MSIHNQHSNTYKQNKEIITKIIKKIIDCIEKESDTPKQSVIWKGNVIFEANLDNENCFSNEKPELVF